MNEGFWLTARELESAGIDFAVVTLVSGRGHVPQDPGAKAIVTPEGLAWGTVGGGKVETRAIRHARELLERRDLRLEPELHTWNLQRDVGMTCGGEIRILFEAHRSRTWRIVIFGAGHVGQALVRALGPIRCHVTCIDPREDWLGRLPPESPKLSLIRAADPRTLVDQLRGDAFCVVMTQGHATDVPILEAILMRLPHVPYVGAIGSPVKGSRIRADLLKAGVPADRIEKLRCPIGLELGSNDPAEIAISVVAELLKTRDAMKSFSREVEDGGSDGSGKD